MIDGFNGIQGIADEYEIDISVIKEYEVIFAIYDTECYSGESYILLKKDGKYFLENSAHCSCYGLNGMWSPTETNEECLYVEMESAKNSKYDRFKFDALNWFFKEYLTQIAS